MPRKESVAADASSDAPVKQAAPPDAAEDAQSVDPSHEAADVVMECAEHEKQAPDADAAVGTKGETQTSMKGGSEDTTIEGKEHVDQQSSCSECHREKSAVRGDKLRVCGGCRLAVHGDCYTDALPAVDGEEKEEREQAMDADEDADWQCDCCRRGVERRRVKCVYCGQAGDSAMKAVEIAADDAFWNQYGWLEARADENMDGVKFGHVLCGNWDPRRLAAYTAKECSSKRIEPPPKKEKESSEAKEITEAAKAVAPVDDEKDAGPDASELFKREMPPTECCFCHSTRGVRIQCRRVNCGQCFHVMCAHQGNGHVDLRTTHIPQFHAYCYRHRECSEDIGDLLAKLITRPIRLLVGRDDMRRFGTVAKHLPTYTSATAVLRDLASLTVGYCNKGLRTSKSEPPDYNVKHLQVLQFFLSHVPQLEQVYALPPTPARDLVNDKKLFRRIERTFDPPRYLAKFPGPFSQQYLCDVCLDPFHERQHLFYCAGGGESSVPHVQHWRCTKRRSSARERELYLPVAGNTTKKKRKTILIVQDGVRRDITLPKGLTSMTDDIICGVCRAPVDARGLIASRKEAKRLEFEKKESKFVHNGCYINPQGAKGSASYSYGTASSASSRKPLRATDSRKANGAFVVSQHAAAQQALGPPKMERINVQRTTKWLACVSQIIRLVGAAAAADPQTPKGALPSNKVTAGAPPAVVVANGLTHPKEAFEAKPAPAVAATATAESSTIAAAPGPAQAKPALNGPAKTEPEAEASPAPSPTTRSKTAVLVTPAVQAQFDVAMRLVRPYDSYALGKLETAHDMLLHRSGPGVAVLRMLTHEYTRFVYIKHTRAVEKARNEKRKRAEHEAQENREKERKRMNLEAERALKKQMLAMRNKQRQQLKATSSK
jgi:hypothetical protein